MEIYDLKTTEAEWCHIENIKYKKWLCGGRFNTIVPVT